MRRYRKADISNGSVEELDNDEESLSNAGVISTSMSRELGENASSGLTAPVSATVSVERYCTVAQ